jgi:serine/threonine-protein phosphatase 2A activator
MLEPAGSHGVWSLDDYQFLPFLWGSAQLCGQSSKGATQIVRPNQVLDKNAVNALKADYLYFAAIAYIHETKTGPFFEHSPVLHSVCNIPGGWEKINGGMFKMYRVEVSRN